MLPALASKRIMQQFFSPYLRTACGLAAALFASQVFGFAEPAPQKADSPTMTIHRSEFGKTSDGQAVDLYTLTNARGNIVKLTNYGAIVTSVEVPDRDGKLENVNLNYPSLEGYLGRHPYFGSTVGRFCNRIAAGKFSLDGKSYTLVQNNGPNHLHGGTVGFDKLLWQAEEMQADSVVGVRFTVTSPDGQEGYPGALTVVAEYTWNDANELAFTFKATTDQPTVINLTNHAYWNLAGAGSGDVLAQELKLNCAKSLAVDDTLIPTGEFLDVAGTPLDFRTFRKLGERIGMLPMTKGYDHCYVVNGEAGTLRTCAVAKDPKSGRVMEVLTTQPGVQLYTGNHLGGEYTQHAGFCLETQHYPDSPNQPGFPTTRLNPGETFEETTVHRFSVE
jgi:aldose 1-epimerase